MARCVSHLDKTASFRCEGCGRPWCEYCTMNSKSLGSCEKCGGRLKKLEDAPPVQPDYSMAPAITPVTYQASSAAEDGEGGKGLLWFVLIYVVGNAILYKTTGILLIPIPRR